MLDKLVLAIVITLAVNSFTGLNKPSLRMSSATMSTQPKQATVQTARNVQVQPPLAAPRSRAKISN